MNVETVRQIARSRGIKVSKKKKADLIHDMQNAEGNQPCFGTDFVADCGQLQCLWREDCLKLYKKASA